MIQVDEVQANSTIKLSNGVSLVGQTRESLKQGTFYYTFPDGTKQYAGLYESDLKEGLWQDYVGNKLVTSFYVKGVRQPLFGTTDQEGRKNGYWIEKCGDNDQLITQGNYLNDIKVGTWQTYFEGLMIEEGDYEQGDKVGKWTIDSDLYDRTCRLTFQGQYSNGLRIGDWTTYYNGLQIGHGTYELNWCKVGQWIEVNEQIKDQHIIKYEGQYNNGSRTGKWTTIYEENEICGGGHYQEISDFYVKQGLWTDIQIDSNQYNWWLTKHSGKYIDDIRTGKWTIIYENSVVGGGNYDDKGLKQGQWIESFDDNEKQFSNQISYTGEYKDGVRIGQWKILDKCESEIGGGIYDENGVKQGKWVDVFKNYKIFCSITFSGDYKNGVRIGNWQTLNRDEVIGGGKYTDEGIKQGQWTDLHENYNEECEVTYTGEYNNGLRTGQWITQLNNYSIENCGGGNYNEYGVKNGQWTDLHESFTKSGKATLSGAYKNGFRTGNWAISYFDEVIGGGNFDEKGEKQGQWTELHSYDSQGQVTISGVYKNDLPIGSWKISYKNNVIGGGEYDDKGVKQGQWTDIHDKFWDYCQVTYSGEYKNGKRIGQWTISLDGNEIGGGIYDDSVKNGQWIEPFQNEFNNCQKVKCSGEYKKGQKIGQWTLTYTPFFRDEQILGGGLYDEKGKKNGLWVEFDKKFNDSLEVTYKGEYKNGMRIGKWITFFQGNEIIGGGTYNEEGLKQGQWTEIDKGFSSQENVLYLSSFSKDTLVGEYQNGVRIGEWENYEKPADNEQ